MNYIKQIYNIAKINKKLKESKNTPHAIIFVCKDKVLMKAYVKLLIMQEVCGFSKKPCFECANCQKIIKDTAIDIEIFGEQKNIMVADSAKIVADSIVVPFEFEKKYFILNNFDRATEQAQNKLLKVIEEPRSFDQFMILTSNIESILPTIRSRAVIYRLPSLTKDDVFEVLKNEGFLRENLKKAVDFCDGNLTKCLKILEDVDYFEMQKLAEKIVMFMQSTANMLEYSTEILKFKSKIIDFFEILNTLFCELLNTKNGKYLSDSTKQNKLNIVASKYSDFAIIKIIEQINLAISKAKINLSTSEIVDNLLLKILEIKYLCK